MTVSLQERIESFVKKILIGILRVHTELSKDAHSPGHSINNILIIRQHDQLGDMLCAVPLLRALRYAFPSARLTLVTGSVSHEVMLHHPYTDVTLLFPKGHFLPIVKFYRLLRKSTYDLAVVPSTVSFSVTSAVLALISRAPVRIGAGSINSEAYPASVCFTIPVKLDWSSDPHRHQAQRNLDILKPLNIDNNDLSTVVGLTEPEKRSASATLSDIRKKHRTLIGIHPGAGKKENRWSPEKFASLVNRLSHETGAGIVMSIGPMDDDVFNQLSSLIQCEYLLFHNKPIREVAAIIDQLDLFISNDTGIMHVAGATAVPLLSLFGPTDPLQWAPGGTKNHYLNSRDGTLDTLSVEHVYEMALLILSTHRAVS